MERVKNVKINYGNPTNPMSKLERITAGQKYFLSSNELKLKVYHLFHKKIVQIGLNSKTTSSFETSEAKRLERVKIRKSRALPRQKDRSELKF